MFMAATSMNAKQTLKKVDGKLGDSGMIGNTEEKETPKQVFRPEPSSSVSQVIRKDESSVPAHSTPRTPICLDQSKLEGHTSHHPSGERSSQHCSSLNKGLGRSMENLDSNKCVWINGITESTTIGQLQDLCRPYGKAMVIRLFKQKRKSDAGSLVAMVKMATVEDADTLVNKLPLHFDEKLNVTVTKKTKRRQRRECHPSSGGNRTGMLEGDETKVKKQKLESDHLWPSNQSGEPKGPLKKSNSWSLLRDSIEDLQCMGFSMLEGFSCLDGEEQQVQRSKDSEVKEHFNVKLNPLQDPENSLTSMKGQNQIYPKSTEEFTQIMRKYLANLLGNETSGPNPQGSHNHPQGSREVQNTRNLPEMEPEMIHERIKENYTHIKEWILTTCVPLSMAFKMVSQTDVNKELLSGALKCLIGIVHQIPQLKVRDLELANENERKKLLIAGKETITNDASVQVFPETLSQIVQTLQMFSQSKYVQTEIESKVQEKCEKTIHSNKSSAKGRQLGVTYVAKASQTSNICKPKCVKAVQTESICLPKVTQKEEFNITKGLAKVSPSRMEGQEHDLSNLDSCSSGKMAKSMPSTSHRSPVSRAQQGSCVTKNEMQNKKVLTKPMQSKGISCSVKGKDSMNSLPQNKEIGNNLGIGKNTVIVKNDKRVAIIKENKEITCVAEGIGKEGGLQTRISKGNTKGQLIESKCVKEKSGKGQEMANAAKNIKALSVDSACVREKTSQGQKMTSLVKESIISAVESKFVKRCVSKGHEMATATEETKAHSVEDKHVQMKESKDLERVNIDKETKSPPVKGRCVEGKASITEEVRSPVVEGKCVQEKARKGKEMTSTTEKTKGLLVESKCVSGKASAGQIASVAEETKSSLAESKCVKGKAGKSQEMASKNEKTKSQSEEGKQVKGKVVKEQMSVIPEERKCPSVEGKCVKGKTSLELDKEESKRQLTEDKCLKGKAGKEKEVSVVKETKSPSNEDKCIKGKSSKGQEMASKGQEMASIAQETNIPVVEGKGVKEKTNKGQMKCTAELTEDKCLKGKAGKEKEVSLAKETQSPSIEDKCIKGKSSKGQEMASIAQETNIPVVEGKCVKEKITKGQMMCTAEETKHPLSKDKCVSGKKSKEKEMTSIVEAAKTSPVDDKCVKKKGMASIVEETKSQHLGDKCSKGKAGKEPMVNIAEKTKISLVQGKSVKEKAISAEETKSPFVEDKNQRGKAKKEQMTNLSEEIKTSVADDKHVKVKADKGMAIEKTKISSVEDNHVKGKANKEQEITNTAEETKNISIKGKCVTGKACKEQKKSFAEETKRPVTEGECIKGSTIKEMSSITQEKKMEDNVATEKNPACHGIGERSVDFENSIGGDKATGKSEEVLELTKGTMKDSGVIDIAIKNKVKEKGPCDKAGDPEEMINVVNFKSESKGDSESKDAKLLSKDVEFEKSEDIKTEDLKNKIKTSDGVMILGTGKKELRDDKRKSSVLGKTSELNRHLENLDCGDINDCKEFKVKVKYTTSSKMILDIDEVSQLDEESGVDNTNLSLGKENTTVESNEFRNIKHDVNLSDNSVLSGTVESSAQDMDEDSPSDNPVLSGTIKSSAQDMDEDSPNRGEKRKMLEFEGMGKNQSACRNERLSVPRKRAKVNKKEAFDAKNESSGVEEDRKQDSCRSTRSQTSVDSSTKLKMIGSKGTDGLQDETENVANESRLGRECEQDSTQRNRASPSCTEVGGRGSQSSIGEESCSVQDNSPAGITDRSRDSTQSEGRFKQDTHTPKSCTNEQECTDMKDKDNSEIHEQNRSKLQECLAVKSSVTPEVCAQRSQDKQVEFRHTRSRDSKEHSKMRTGGLDKDKQKNGGSSLKECKSESVNVDNKKENQKPGQRGQPCDKSEKLKNEGIDVKMEGTGREQIDGKIKDKNEKENTKREERQRTCKGNKDVSEGQGNSTEKAKETQKSKEILHESKVGGPTCSTKNIDEKREQASSCKLGEKQGSKDGKNSISECKQEDQKQTRKDKHVVSKEVSKVSSRRSPRDTSGSSGKSKKDEETLSRRNPERNSTTEGSNSFKNKEDSGAAREGRQLTRNRTAASSTTPVSSSSRSSSHEPQKRGRVSRQKSSEAVPQTRQSRSSIIRKRTSKSPAHSRSRSPIPRNTVRKSRTRKPCTRSKLHTRYETSKTADRSRSKDFGKSKSRVWDSIMPRHKIPSVNEHVEGKGCEFANSDKTPQRSRHMFKHGLSSKDHEGDDSVSPNLNREDHMEYVTDYKKLGNIKEDCAQSSCLSKVRDFKSIVNEYFESGPRQNNVNELNVPSQSSVAGTDPSSVAPYLSSYAENQFNHSYSSYNHYYNDSYYQGGPLHDPLPTCMSWSSANPQVPLDCSGLPVSPQLTEWEYTGQTLVNQPYLQ